MKCYYSKMGCKEKATRFVLNRTVLLNSTLSAFCEEHKNVFNVIFKEELTEEITEEEAKTWEILNT
jgi:hypothetical protein